MATITRQGYQLIAEIIKDIAPYTVRTMDGKILSGTDLRREIARVFAKRFEKLSTSFNRERFLIACGVRADAEPTDE